MPALSKRCFRHLAGALCLAALASVCSSSPRSAAPVSRTLAGVYNGSQTEMAVALELGRDGRFRYALSYGALDEQAQGNWTVDARGVHLTSDPVNPPRFELVGRKPTADARLRIDLDVPRGLSRGHFSALIVMPDGRAGVEQLGENGLDIDLRPDGKPVSVAMILPVYEIEGESVTLPPGDGASLRFRFEPNDLGKVAFANELLRKDAGALLLERHGRLIRFRRTDRQVSRDNRGGR